MLCDLLQTHRTLQPSVVGKATCFILSKSVQHQGLTPGYTSWQVGIIALNLIGDPMSLPLSSITNTAQVLPAASSLASLSLGGPPFPAPSSNPTWAGGMAPPAAASLAAPQPAFSPVPHLAKSGSLGSSTGAAADLATQLNVDVTTAQKILELQERKKKVTFPVRACSACASWSLAGRLAT